MVRENVPLSELTTMSVGGRARKVVSAESRSELIDALERFAPSPVVLCGRPSPSSGAVVIGRGSNLLVSDKGFDGTVVATRFRSLRLTADGVYASSGTTLNELARFCLRNGLSGLEWAAGIPGSVGGAAVMNAGAFGCDLAGCVLYVDTVCGRLTPDVCRFGYRTSAIAVPVVGVCFAVRGDDQAAVAARMSGYAAERKRKQPRGKSAGSVFRAADKPAAVYIDGANLKGRRIGGAEISRKHANFIVNTGGATAADVVGLIELCKATVRDRYGVTLEEEIRYLGEF